jgi:DNA (cytosine-5)-methyltransferase 1
MKMKTKKSKLKVIDLFAGCGGMSLGFEKAGAEILAAYDNWEPAIKIYKDNFKHEIHNADLSNVEIASTLRKYNADAIIGGPPCQDFSSAGHRNEKLGRADLTLSYAEIVTKVSPKIFVMENVPTITKSKILTNIKSTFIKAGYGIVEITLDASYCGVPQKRKRYFLIGIKNHNPQDLEQILLSNLSKKPLSIYDYLGNSLGVEYYFRVPRSYSRRGIFSIYEPSMTIRGVDRPVPKGYLGHPKDPVKMNEKIRELTPKERSLIQTFPNDFSFNNLSKTNLNQVIGNAVPVELARYVAQHLIEYCKTQSIL